MFSKHIIRFWFVLSFGDIFTTRQRPFLCSAIRILIRRISVISEPVIPLPSPHPVCRRSWYSVVRTITVVPWQNIRNTGHPLDRGRTGTTTAITTTTRPDAMRACNSNNKQVNPRTHTRHYRLPTIVSQSCTSRATGSHSPAEVPPFQYADRQCSVLSDPRFYRFRAFIRFYCFDVQRSCERNACRTLTTSL